MNDVMKQTCCPFCKGSLEKGELKSRGGVFFLPEGEKMPTWMVEPSLEKRRAISVPPFPLDHPPRFPSALACRNCGIIILDYEKDA